MVCNIYHTCSIYRCIVPCIDRFPRLAITEFVAIKVYSHPTVSPPQSFLTSTVLIIYNLIKPDTKGQNFVFIRNLWFFFHIFFFRWPLFKYINFTATITLITIKILAPFFFLTDHLFCICIYFIFMLFTF